MHEGKPRTKSIESADAMFQRYFEENYDLERKEKIGENPTTYRKASFYLIKTHNWSNAITSIDASLLCH